MSEHVKMSCSSNLTGYLPETKPDQNLYLFICLWSHDQDGHHSHTGYKPFKMISEIKKPAGLGHGMQHWECGLYQVRKNDDSRPRPTFY